MASLMHAPIKHEPLLIIVASPSGGGKTTLIEEVVKEFPDNFARCVTDTTRAPREGEVDGVDYNFLYPDQFEAMVLHGEFLEHAQVYGHSYGTRRRSIQNPFDQGKHVFLAIDVQGHQTFRELAKTEELIKKSFFSIFLLPSGIPVLRKRLELRGKDSPEVIEKRLIQAKAEMARASEFDRIVFSGKKEKVKQDFLAAISQELLKRQRAQMPNGPRWIHPAHPELSVRSRC